MRKLASISSVIGIFFSSAAVAEVNVPVSCSHLISEKPDTNTVSLPVLKVESDASLRKLKSSTPYVKIDSESMQTTGITDISDAMRRMPGVNLRDYGGAGGMKTVSVRGLGAEHTAVVYDGITLSDCQSGQIDLSRYSLDNIKAISLYAGDNDDIFMPARAAASASSVYISSFTTPAAGDVSPHLKVQMRTGSFGFYNPFVRFSKGFDNGFSLSANAEFIHSKNNYPFTLKNGSIITREKRENSQMNSWHGEINGLWRLDNGKSLGAKLYYYDNARYLPGPVIYYVSKSNEHIREKNFFGQMQFKGRLSSVLSTLVLAKFNWSTSRYTDIDGKYPDGIRDDYYIQRETYASGCLLYTPVENLSMDYSVDWAWNNLSSNTRNSIRPFRHSLLQTLSAKYSVWRLTAMARVLYSVYVNKAKDGAAGKNAQRLSTMVSISLRPAESVDFFVRTSYKNIFRLPTFNEAYFDNYGSVNLDPEITDQFNLGFTYQVPSSSRLSDLTLTLDGYINNIRNKIVAIPVNMFLWSMTNLGKARGYGMDATLSSAIEIANRQSILVNGTYSYQRAQVRTSPEMSDWMKQLAYVPLNSGSASVSWLNPWTDISLHATACGSRYTNNFNIPETKIAGYIDAGVSVSRRFTIGKTSLDARFDLINIFDKQYEIVASYPMPGRSWKFTIDFQL